MKTGGNGQLLGLIHKVAVILKEHLFKPRPLLTMEVLHDHLRKAGSFIHSTNM